MGLFLAFEKEWDSTFWTRAELKLNSLSGGEPLLGLETITREESGIGSLYYPL